VFQIARRVAALPDGGGNCAVDAVMSSPCPWCVD